MSVIADLKWRDLQQRTDSGQVTVFGKGSKTRVVLLPSGIWRELQRFGQHASLDGPIFESRRGGGHLVQTTLGHASVATTGRYLHARSTDSSSNNLAI